MSNSLKIGFVGLGSMGMGMACSLVKAGFSVKGYDIREPVQEAFSAAGGVGVSSVADAATDVDLFIILVVNSEQADDVLFGSGNAANVLPRGSAVFLGSTVSPDYSKATAARLAELGLDLLDAPVSGGPIRAAAGTISIMLAGDPAVIDRVYPALDAMAEHVHRMGDEIGLGATMKLVNQVLAGIHITAATEAVAFGTRAGLDAQKIFDVISTSAGNSWMFQNRVPHIIEDDYSPASVVDIWPKDLGLVLETAKGMSFPMPISSAAFQLFMMASAAGYGKIDDAAAVKVYEDLVGFKVVGNEANETGTDEG